MWSQAYIAGAIALLALLGLAGANFAYDHGAPDSLSRRVPAMLGGVAFLIAVLWLDPWVAVTVAGVLTVAMIVVRLGFRRGLRGVRGRLPAHAWAEIAFPMAGMASLAVGWGLLGDRWLAFVPIAFMAWGDSAAGLVREAFMWRGKRMNIWPSTAMFGVCLAAALLFNPYWIAAAGALAATATERFGPTTRRLWDDNWAIVGASLGVMAFLSTTTV